MVHRDQPQTHCVVEDNFELILLPPSRCTAMPDRWTLMSRLSLFSLGNGHRTGGETLVDIPLGLRVF